MTRPARIARHLVHGAIVVVLLALASVALHTAPREEGWQAPIVVTGQTGEELRGRNLVATVTGIRAADSVSTPSGWTGDTSGIWIVVDVTAETVTSEYGTPLGYARVVIDGVSYGASERPEYDTLYSRGLATGIPTSGPLFFEIPRGVYDRGSTAQAELLLALDSDPRADSVLRVPLELDGPPRVAELETEVVRVGDA